MISPFKLRAALVAAACFLILAASETRAATRARTPGVEDMARAEKILIKLRQLEAAAATADSGSFHAVVKQLYPALFADVARLRDGDLKTDLSTAVFLYEAAHANRHTERLAVDGCDDQLRDIYLTLCRENEGGESVRFLWAKARLHVRWAAAVIGQQRGAGDAATRAALSEMRAARAADAQLAARAVAALKQLAGRVHAYSSLHEFEERGEVAGESFERFSVELETALGEVDRVLAALPRGPIRHALRNARNAFRAGASRWRMSSRAGSKTVSINALAAPDPLKGAGLEAGAVNYTVVCDWRKAIRALEEAQALVEELRDEGVDAATGGK